MKFSISSNAILESSHVGGTGEIALPCGGNDKPQSFIHRQLTVKELRLSLVGPNFLREGELSHFSVAARSSLKKNLTLCGLTVPTTSNIDAAAVIPTMVPFSTSSLLRSVNRQARILSLLPSPQVTSTRWSGRLKYPVLDFHFRTFSNNSVDKPTLEEDTDTSIESDDQDGEPVIHFPWRHEDVHNMLPRLQLGTKEQQTLIPPPVGSIGFTLAVMFLDVSIWDGLFLNKWKTNLCEGASYAFIQAVAGVLSNVYRIPFDKVRTTLMEESLPPRAIFPSGATSLPRVSFQYPTLDPSDDKDSKEVTPSAQKDDDSLYCPEIDDMMTRPLRQLFEHHRKEINPHEKDFRIHLDIVPKSAAFHRLYGLPFVTRAQVEDDPHLLRDFFFKQSSSSDQKMQVADQSHAVQQYTDHIRKMQQRGDKTVRTTIVAEVMVICEEVFYVKRKGSDEVIQGEDPEDMLLSGFISVKDGKISMENLDDTTNGGQDVGHMVTMERDIEVTMDDRFPWRFDVVDDSNWKVIDIDDLTGARKWYHMVLPEGSDGM